MLFEYVLKEWKGGGGCHQRRKLTVLNLKSNLVISNWWWCGRQIQDIQGLKNYRYKENDSWDFIAISICIYIILDINAKDSYNSVRILLTLSKVYWTLSDNQLYIGYSNIALSNNASPSVPEFMWVLGGWGEGGGR